MAAVEVTLVLRFNEAVNLDELERDIEDAFDCVVVASDEEDV